MLPIHDVISFNITHERTHARMLLAQTNERTQVRVIVSARDLKRNAIKAPQLVNLGITMY